MLVFQAIWWLCSVVGRADADELVAPGASIIGGNVTAWSSWMANLQLGGSLSFLIRRITACINLIYHWQDVGTRDLNDLCHMGEMLEYSGDHRSERVLN